MESGLSLSGIESIATVIKMETMPNQGLEWSAFQTKLYMKLKICSDSAANRMAKFEIIIQIVYIILMRPF